MILRIDHVSLAVKDYEKAYSFFTRLLGALPAARAEDRQMKYIWQLMNLGDLSRLELLTPTGRGSFLEGFLADKQGGVHHITMQTSDIRKAREHLDKNNIPYFGYSEYSDNWKELFIHPRDAFGVLIQIAEFNPDDWVAPEVRMESARGYEVTKSSNGIALRLAHPGGGTVECCLNKEQASSMCREIQKLIDMSNE